MKFELRRRDFIWFALFAIAIWLFMLNKCNQPAPAVNNSYRDSAIAIYAKVDSVKNEVIKFLSDSLMKINVEKGQSDIRINQLESKLSKSVLYSSSLAHQLKDAKDLIEDTGMIAVHPSYVSYCDTCADQLLYQSALVMSYKGEVQNKDELYKREIAIKDSALAQEKRYNERERLAFNLMSKGYNELAQKSQPRNQVYGELIGEGNQINPFGALGLGGFLLTKKGHSYGVAAKMQRDGNIWYEFRKGFLISFRRR